MVGVRSWTLVQDGSSASLTGRGSDQGDPWSSVVCLSWLEGDFWKTGKRTCPLGVKGEGDGEGELGEEGICVGLHQKLFEG